MILKNPRLELLAQQLAMGKDQYAAAEAAGYDPKVPSFRSNARKRVAKVRQRVAELQERAAEKATGAATVTLSWLMGKLVEIIGAPLNLDELKPADRLRAMDMVAKIRGFYAPTAVEVIQRLGEMGAGELDALEQALAASAEQRRAEQRSESEAMH
jgi:hypothetical protein